MQSKGSALAFVFVLLVMCLGGYAAFNTLAKGRSDAVIPSESQTPPTGAETTATSSIPAHTNTPEAAASPDSELSTPVVPTATPVPPPTPTLAPQPTPTATPSPTIPAAEPTPAPPSGPHQFYVIRNERDCAAGGIIGGWVYDADGNGLPWVNISLYSQWWSAPLKQSEGPPQSGKYEFAMGYDAALFRLLIVDANGQPLSAVIDVDYQPDCSYRIDWQRVH
jgi:hypothetical protein